MTRSKFDMVKPHPGKFLLLFLPGEIDFVNKKMLKYVIGKRFVDCV
jgi:hypothetical protein